MDAAYIQEALVIVDVFREQELGVPLAPTKKTCSNKVDKLCRLFLRVATKLAPLLHLP